MQRVNIAFIAYILLVTIVPAILTNYFEIAIYPSKFAHPGAAIYRGDIMVSKVVPISSLAVNDVLLVRDSNTWYLDVRQVASKTIRAGLSVVVTMPTGGLPINKTYILPNSTEVHKITNIIPKLGYVPIVLASTITRIVAGLLWFILNVTVQIRRARGRQKVKT